MLFQQLKRGEGLDQCPSCNRIIYYRAVMPAGASDESRLLARVDGLLGELRQDAPGYANDVAGLLQGTGFFAGP